MQSPPKDVTQNTTQKHCRHVTKTQKRLKYTDLTTPYKYANEENAIARYIRSLHAHNKYTYIVAQE